ncbi:MAG: hypothetical protein ACK5YW_08210 [Betaproteobacteria bacterium]|jgi:hypothetical protein|nr:hypothetical protein [Rhodocyclaceae bacterium]MCA3134522.1 hypothetical protein [Rhodocyclaceae bacterium]MCA3143911.1 hypothetical protein [Rhodocyclaceae bacterium]MCA3145713.1 hypothetical protein [Rhodocyclaceae bacterium]MCE2897139.1 hypothetical protein [Betaproteobacteria bacterium]
MRANGGDGKSGAARATDAVTGCDRMRRRLLGAAAVMVSGAGLTARAQPAASLVDQPRGGLRFLPGGPVYAGGVVAAEGFEIVHTVLGPWLPLEEAYGLIERHLAARGRPMQALCGMELRIPAQLSMAGFRAFNQPYVERLVRWGLIVEGRNPVCRTNVAPLHEPPEQPCVHGFSYTVPGGRGSASFVMSGMTEIGPGGSVVAPGDTSPEGMRRKLRFVFDAVSARLSELGQSWENATQVEFYAAAAPGALIEEFLAPAVGGAARRGIRWHLGRPPVEGAEVELEARAAHREEMVGG